MHDGILCAVACIQLSHILSFQVKKSDFKEFDFIFGMDESNISELRDIAPSNATAQVELLGKYDPEGVLLIRDPYYVSDDMLLCMLCS